MVSKAGTVVRGIAKTRFENWAPAERDWKHSSLILLILFLHLGTLEGF